MIEFGLFVARLLHYAAVTTLAGASFFPLYAYADAKPIVLLRWRQGVLLAAAIASLLSGVLWFVFAVANMSGTLADVGDREVLWMVLNETTFGRVWTARLVLSIIMVGLFWNRVVSKLGPRRDLITPVLAAGLLISLAGVGHPQVEEGVAGIIHVASDAAHLLAAGAWLGGLVPLGYILLLHGREKGPAERSDLNEILLRFSGMGYVAVATLIGSGLVNSWFLVGSVSGLFATQYGQLLIVKLVLFAGHVGTCGFEQVLDSSVTEQGSERWPERFDSLDCQTAQPCARRALAAKNDFKQPEEPLWFLKAPNSYWSANRPIERPATYAGQIIYEGELGVVIGKKSSSSHPRICYRCEPRSHRLPVCQRRIFRPRSESILPCEVSHVLCGSESEPSEKEIVLKMQSDLEVLHAKKKTCKLLPKE
jgi:putative copper resistance protein D